MNFKDKADHLSAKTIVNEMFMTGDLSRLDGNAVKVYLAVKAFADTGVDKGGQVPRAAAIAGRVGLSEDEVVRCLKVLEANGYLQAA